MKKLLLSALTAGLLASVGSAQAQTQVCSKGGDTRKLEVLTPGVVGKACDLRYTYNNGATIKTPYHANNSVGFCAQKAQTLLTELQQDGFSCGAGAVTVTASAVAEPIAVESELPATPAPVEVAAAEPAPEALPIETAQVASAPVAEETNLPEAPAIAEVAAEEAAVVSTEVAEAPAPVEVARVVQLETPVYENPETVTSDIATEAVESVSEAEKIIAEPAPAMQGPVTLTSASAVTTRNPKPRKSAVGRLMGAEPEDPGEPPLQGTVEPVRVAAAAPTPATPTETAPVIRDASQAVDEAMPAPKAYNTQKLRPSPDIIRGVLAAQAAAWNEGDLEAFMGGYWKSPDLRFVSGTEVTGGWSQALKRYRNRYEESGDMGELSFDKLDVEMVTDNVAIIVGRFNLERSATADTGVFTLVMKRFEGRWRIVHDHTVGDQTASTE